MAKSRLPLVAPTTVIGTVEPTYQPPKRVRNAEVRAREYLTNAEVDRLIKAAGVNRNGHRDAPWCWSPTGMACVPSSW
jgi:type 1 fimbriae regulatory protein FimB/type 1 fimbriae regulatory protein FimE